MSISIKRKSSGVASTFASLPKSVNGYNAYEAFTDDLDIDDHCIDIEDEHTPPSLSSMNSNLRQSTKKIQAPKPPEEKIDPSTLPSENQIKQKLNDWFDAVTPISEVEKNHLNKSDKMDQWRYIMKQIKMTKKCLSSLYLINLKGKREILSTLRNLKRHLLVLDNDENFLNELEKGNIIFHIVSVLTEGVKCLVNKRLSQFQRDSNHLIVHDSLVCINFFCRENKSVNLSDSMEFYESVICCLNDSFGRKITTIALEVLHLAVQDSQGFGNLITCLSQRKQISGRCTLLGPVVNIRGWEYIKERTALALIRLVNTLIKNTRDNEEQIWFQYELVSAGFHANKLDLLESSDDLRDSLNEYHKNLIDVDSLKSDSSHELQLLREENKKLLQQLAESKNFRIQEKSAIIFPSKETKVEQQNNRQDISIPIAPPINLEIINQSPQKRELNIDTLKIKPKERMPLYNWSPIRNLKGTIFEDLNHNDQSILDSIDFRDFERRFCTSSPVGSQRFKRIMDKSSSNFLFVEANRSQNIIITKKRTNLTVLEIRNAIENLKIDLIPSDVAEILIKFIPTDQELEDLAKSVSKRSHYGEAEEFIYQLSQIERLANKLETIYFLNQFDDSIGRLSPVIDSITKASLSLIDNRRFFKFLKIVLCLGNFTNYGKKQYTFGYKINSLSKLTEVKSNDKQQDLLQYIIGIVHEKFPELVTFHEAFELKLEKGVSYKSIKLEINTLAKKLNIACEEIKENVNKATLEKLLQKSVTSVSNIEKSFQAMSDKWGLVCILYGENLEITEPYDFFKTVSEFIQIYKETERKMFLKPNVIVSKKPLEVAKPIETDSRSKFKSSFTQQAKDLHNVLVEQMKQRKSLIKTDKSVEEALNDLDEAIEAHSRLTLRTSSEIVDESHL